MRKKDLSSVLYNFKDKNNSYLDYVTQFLNRTLIMFKYENLPDTIKAEELEKLLQIHGEAVAIKHSEKLYIVQGSPGGVMDQNYEPTTINVANPFLNISERFTIGTNCVWCKNDYMTAGLIPLISKYATLLVENELSMKTLSVNARASFVISANDNNTFISAEKFLKAIETGDQAVIQSNMLSEGINVNPLHGQTGYMQQLLEYEQYLKGSFYQEIGLSAKYDMKREAINSNESLLQADELHPLVDTMLECRKNFIDQINKLFNTNIKVSFGSVWEKNENNIHDFDDESEGY